MLTTVDLRLFLDRNPNALGAAPRFAPGDRLDPGLYWDPAAQRLEVVEHPGTASTALYRISRHLDATFDDLVHTLALGGGGPTGDPEAMAARRR